MTLSFSTNINGKPTFFVDKIWEGLPYGEDIAEDYLMYYHAYFRIGQSSNCVKKHQPKIHTIRTDKSNRWKGGKKIHFVINNRTPLRYQFAPVVLCQSVQRVEIKPVYKQVTILYDWHQPRDLLASEIQELATNDGFDRVEDFWDYFSKDFSGKLIHWTNKRY